MALAKHTYKVPLGASRVLSITSSDTSSLSTTMLAKGKNVNTGFVYSLGSVTGVAIAATALLTFVFTAANGLAVGDKVRLQAHNSDEIFAPNDQEPDEIVVEIIERWT